MDHDRPISKNDHETLILLQQHRGEVVMAPVFHNGKACMALALVCQNETSVFLRILGIALNPGDNIQDKLGNQTAFTPPMVSKEALN